MGLNGFVEPSQPEGRLGKLLMEEIERSRPARVVLDSLSEMRLLAQSPLRYRREILRLKQRLGELGGTVLLLDDRSSQGTDVQVHSLVHGAISLNAAPLKYGIFRRALAVTKVRGVSFREGNHDYVIERGGVRVFARLVAAEHHTPFRKTLAASENRQLDELVGKGLHYGTSNLIIGPAGSGKSTISMLFESSNIDDLQDKLLATIASILRRSSSGSIDQSGSWRVT